MLDSRWPRHAKRTAQFLLLVVAPLVVGGGGALFFGGRHTLLDELLAITFCFAMALWLARRIWPDTI